MSVRKYWSIAQLLEDYNRNRRATARNAEHANALHQKMIWSWYFLMRRWRYPDTADIDAIVRMEIER